MLRRGQQLKDGGGTAGAGALGADGVLWPAVVIGLGLWAAVGSAAGSGAAQADEPGDEDRRLVLWRLSMADEIAPVQREAIQDMIAAGIARRGREVLTERDVVRMLQYEETKLRCGSDVSCMAEIGAALGVPEIATGSVARLGESWVLSLQRIDVRRARVLGRCARRFEGEVDAVLDEVPAALAEVFGPVRAGGDGARAAGGARADGAGARAAGGARADHGEAVAGGGGAAAGGGERGAGGGERGAGAAAGEVIAGAGRGRSMPAATVWGHVSFWPGVALVGSSVAMGVLAAEARDDGQQAPTPEKLAAAEDRMELYEALAVGGGVLGGALVCTGIVLWLWPEDESDEGAVAAPSVAPWGGPDGGGLALGWRF